MARALFLVQHSLKHTLALWYDLGATSEWLYLVAQPMAVNFRRTHTSRIFGYMETWQCVRNNISYVGAWQCVKHSNTTHSD